MKVKNKACLVLILFLILLSGCQNNIISQISRDNNIKVEDKPRPGVVAIIDSNIIVTKPLSNDVISSPVEITGRARVFEGTVLYRLKDANEKLIAKNFTTAKIGAPEWGFYSAKLEFELPNTKTGWLEVYTESAKDGSEQDLIRLPIVFEEYEKIKVKLYFSNIKKDPEVKECDKVFAVERDMGDVYPTVEGVINELLKGVTEEELEDGYLTNLPEQGVKLQKVDLQEGVLTVDFNQALQEEVAGSCRVEAIRSQIIETLKQFEDVDEVIISIDGETENILQP